MKELPILFKGEMVRAIIEGRKTQTRRIVKPQPSNCGFDGPPIYNSSFGEFCYPAQRGWKCPYGTIGDRLWVRESFWLCDMPGMEDTPCIVYEDEWIKTEDGRNDYKPKEVRPTGYNKFGHIPSIHMPRWASRINLEITAIGVERLHDISEGAARDEGVEPFRGMDGWYKDYWSKKPAPVSTARESFLRLWESINGAGSWDKNPWVWVIEFKRLA